MRVTESMTFSTMINNMQTLREKLAKLQEQAATTYRVNAPSDDPQATLQIYNLKGIKAATNQYLSNIKSGNAWLKQAESALSSISDVIGKAKDAAFSMANGSGDPALATSMTSLIRQLKEEVVVLGNTKYGDSYIFGGYKTESAPFSTTLLANGSVDGTYNGTADSIRVEIGPGSSSQINLTGDSVLRGGTPPGSTGTDIVGMMDNLLNALTANDSAAIQALLPQFGKAMDQITAARSEVGARMVRLDTGRSMQESVQVNLTDVISGAQDADMVKVMTELSQQQTVLQASLSASAKISQVSLLDYLK
jgi:flagellar hook-associated protein 3 FlgL